MRDPPKWFQFNLRSLTIGVTLQAVPLGYFGWQAKIVTAGKARLNELKAVVNHYIRPYPIGLMTTTARWTRQDRKGWESLIG
jgi:hypothetical protein